MELTPLGVPWNGKRFIQLIFELSQLEFKLLETFISIIDSAKVRIAVHF